MNQDTSRSTIALVLLVAALPTACGMPVRRVLPTVEEVPAPRAPKPSVLLVLADPTLRFPSAGTQDLKDYVLTAHVEVATREAALFERFQITSLADARLPDFDYTIRLVFRPGPPRYSPALQVLSLFTLFVVPDVSHFPIALSATLEDRQGALLKQYRIEDEMANVFALWAILLMPFAFGSEPGDIVENVMMTLYLQMSEDDALEGH